MKKTSKILLGALFLSMVFSMVNINYGVAVVPDLSSSDTYEGQLQANTRTPYLFRERTQLTVYCSQNLDLKIDCEALQIGVKYFEIELDADADLEMNMTCKEEEAELGLINGHAHTARNRNRYQYQEGFCIKLQTNGTFKQAKLKIQATNQNRLSMWAYYDEATAEWVSVTTVEEDGYLVAETDHFSTWTLLLPEVNYLPLVIVGITIFAGVIGAIAIVYYIKKR